MKSEDFINWWDAPHPESNPTRRYHRPGWLKRLVQFFLPGRVSRIHLYEAQEHYLFLARMLEYHKETTPPETKTTEEEVAAAQATRILDDAAWLLTRRQNDLNYLWRDLCRVHIMLVEHVLPPDLLATQLDHCREQARRLGAEEDPVVREMLERLAEATTDKNPQPENKARMVRAIRALLERFTTIRTDRIHQQFVNIRTYQKALVVLVTLSIILIANVETVVRSPKRVAADASTVAPVVETTQDVPGETMAPPKLDCQSAYLGCVAEVPILFVDWLRYYLARNILLFVFLAGLTGGFFSVVIRLRDRNLVPGEDAYFLWYVLSKPVVGALGAMVLFILLQANFIDFRMAEGLTRDLLTEQRPGAAVFGFSFLAGFSERVVFPHFR